MSAVVTPLGIRSRGIGEVECLADALLERVGISRVADVTDLDFIGIPVYNAVRPKTAPGLTTVSSGKGLTRKTARVSAIMEAVERTYGEVAQTVTGSYTDLVRHGHTLDPRKLVLRRGCTWAPDCRMTWTQTHCISNDVEVLAPALAVLVPFPRESDMMVSNSIGLAAGNDFTDAAIQGLYEVIEHDSTAFGEKLRAGYRVQVESLPKVPRDLVSQFMAGGLNVAIHVYSGGLPVPTFFVIIDDPHARDGMLFNGGAGCHLEPEIALTRALTEAAQSRLSVISGAREDLDGQAYRRHASYAELRSHLTAWSDGRSWISYDAIPRRSSGNNEADLEHLIGVLREAGLNLILTKQLAPAGLPFSVVKVIVPGTEFSHVDHRRVGARMLRARDHGTDDWLA